MLRWAVMAAGAAAVAMPAWADYAAGLHALAYKDYRSALTEFSEAAERGDVRAQFGLGFMYRRGQGVAPDPAEAARWYQRAALQGHRKAQYVLGALYASGKELDRDDAQAARWYRMAAEQGDPAAQLALGGLYEQGAGVALDRGEAAGWYRAAAEQGYAPAQAKLGRMYAAGAGVPRDRVRAYVWLDLAVASGLGTAQDDRDRIGAGMLESELVRAQADSEAWMARFMAAGVFAFARPIAPGESPPPVKRPPRPAPEVERRAVPVAPVTRPDLAPRSALPGTREVAGLGRGQGEPRWLPEDDEFRSRND